jgi:hypothetical protein
MGDAEWLQGVEHGVDHTGQAAMIPFADAFDAERIGRRAFPETRGYIRHVLGAARQIQHQCLALT